MKSQIISDIMNICPDLNEKGLERDTVANLWVFLNALKKA